MKNILVTGGAGFIGSHTCLILLQKGFNVFVIDSFSNSSPFALEKVNKVLINQKILKSNLQVFRGDILDPCFLENVFKKIIDTFESIDGVLHFAGLKSVKESFDNPFLYWKVNFLGTYYLMEKIIRFKCKNLVFSSSAAIYSAKNNSYLKETSEKNPSSPYGKTKLAIEQLLEDIFKSNKKNINISCLRYFNPIGAHESGFIGECPKGEPNNIFPLLVNAAIGKNKVLNIYGSDWPTKDGTAIRDYIHVMDVAEAHVKVLEYLLSNKEIYIAFNIGTGKGTTILELIKTFENVNNVKVPYIYSERRIGDEAYVVADNSYSISKLNLMPIRSIEDMCRDSWKWIQNNKNGYY